MNITIGQISTIILFLVAFIGGVIKLVDYLKTGLKSTLKEEFNTINEKVDKLDKKINNTTINQDKNFLTTCFDDLEHNKQLNDTTKERIYECMEEYTKLGGNSYIHDKFEKLRKEGLL